VQNAALRELDARLYFLFLFCACSRILVVLNNKECEERFLLVEKKTVEREPSRVSHSSEKIKTSDSRLLSSDFFFFALCTFSLFFAFFSPVHVHDVIFCVWSLSLSLLNHMKKKRTKKRKNRRHLPRSFGNWRGDARAKVCAWLYSKDMLYIFFTSVMLLLFNALRSARSLARLLALYFIFLLGTKYAHVLLCYRKVAVVVASVLSSSSFRIHRKTSPFGLNKKILLCSSLFNSPSEVA